PAESVGDFWRHLYGYSWFVGFGISFVTYLLGRKLAQTRK
ncbi:MAG: hypothetical protein RL692_524, partial [Planctomycetota bacterium]